MNLSRGRQPAYISHIRRTRLKSIFLIKRSQKTVHFMSKSLLHILYCFKCFSVIGCSYSRHLIASRIGCCQLIRIGQLLLCIRRNSQLPIILIENPLQSKVAHCVRKSVNKLPFNGRLCHQSCSLCNFVYSRLKLHRLRYMIRTNHIKHRRCRLNYIGTASACICNRIMDTSLINHVLS